MVSEIRTLLDKCHNVKILCTSMITVRNIETFTEFPYSLEPLNAQDSDDLFYALSP